MNYFSEIRKLGVFRSTLLTEVDHVDGVTRNTGHLYDKHQHGGAPNWPAVQQPRDEAFQSVHASLRCKRSPLVLVNDEK